jgi:hypothetical protein
MRKAIQAAIVLAGVMAPVVSHACFMASHHWRIVLGESRDGVVLLDLPLYRNDREVACKLGKKDRRCFDDAFDEPSGKGKAKGMGTKLEVFWAGDASLRLFTANGQVPKLLSRLGSLTRPGFYPDVKPLLARARKAASSLPGFVPVALPDQDFCDYSRSWGRYELLSDDQGQVSLRLSQGDAKHVLPVSLPEAFRSALADDGSAKEGAEALWIMSVFSYALASGELLVLDIGTGDEIRDPAVEAIYPRCGCVDIQDCLPLPSTVHHGMQAQVIVRSPLPAPARPNREQAPEHKLTAEDLPAAEGRAPFVPRSDGIYLSVPTCTSKGRWSRPALRFAPNGNASMAEGNLSPMDAAILTSKHYIGMQTGTPCTVKGAHVHCELGPGMADREQGDEVPPLTLLDGRWDGEWLDVLVTPPAGGKPRVEALRFAPLDPKRLKEIDEE